MPLLLSDWRRWLRPVVMSFYLILLLIALPLCIWELQVNDAALHVQGWFIGGLFVLFTIPISLWGILQHLVNYTRPYLQRHIIRILWMVPIYAVNAWFALKFPVAAIYLDTIRECYEAYVIYNFLIYLLNYLRSEHPDLEGTLECKPHVKHLVPFCCLPAWTMGSPLVQHCKHGVLQYTIIRPVTTVIALFCEWGHVYGEGNLNFKNGWSYLVVINNISQIWAMYCLVLFYKATKEELKPLKPLSKFLCVKAVVFMSFWQAVLIALLVEVGIIKQNPTWDFFTPERVATGLQDFCICIEMLIAAVAHYFSFSHVPYISSGHEQIPCCKLVLSMCDVSDVHADVYEHARFVGKTVSGAVGGPLHRRNGAQEERQPLLTDQSGRHTTRPSYNIPPIPLQVLNRQKSYDSSESATEVTYQEKLITDSLCNYVQFEKSTRVERSNSGPSETVIEDPTDDGPTVEEPPTGTSSAGDDKEPPTECSQAAITSAGDDREPPTVRM